MVTTITEVLNIWNNMGVFSYMIPFLLIFAVVFAILDKTKMLSSADNDNRMIIAIISASIGLLSLQFDFVSTFFAVIFPRFGIGLALFLVILIFVGFFHPEGSEGKWSIKIAWVGWVVGVGVFIWSLSAWDEWSSQMGFGGWFVENIWAILVLGILIGLILAVARSGKN
ncbi:MAG: hypothetical protein OEL87_02510 [Nanoarchaeota archaeon]|nr:hypothetical protein [Nanoarchaeota archaeon]